MQKHVLANVYLAEHNLKKKVNKNAKYQKARRKTNGSPQNTTQKTETKI